LKASVDFAVKNLTRAQLPTESISIRFVQVGFSRELRQALEALNEDIPRRRPEAVGVDVRFSSPAQAETLCRK
jgi:hypothetical protein